MRSRLLAYGVDALMPKFKTKTYTQTLALSLLVASGQLPGQDTTEEATFGTIELTGNFQPDPHSVDLQAGGSISASTIEGCSGYISSAPDYELNFTELSEYALSFFVVSETDTTLIINAPSGDWHCDDDFDDAAGTNPGVVFSSPETGVYDIWVGTYAEGENFPAAELIITEMNPPWQSTSSSTPTPETGEPGVPTLSSSGTGFVVSDTGHVLTNHHVIEGCTRMTFQLRGELPLDASLVSSNSNTDLALLKTTLNTSPAKFRSRQSVRLGDEVVVYGFPLMGDLSSQGNLTNGIVSALSGLNDDLSRLQMTAQIQPGNSGGPVMNRSGEIVGVVVETANEDYFREQRGTDTQNLNFAVRDSLATSFLDTNNVDYQIGSADGRLLTIADIAEAAQEFTGLILCYK